MVAVCQPESRAAVANCRKKSSKSPLTVKTSRIKNDGSATKIAPTVAVEVLGPAGEKGERETEPLLPAPGPSPPPRPLLSDPLLDGVVDDDILSTKRS